MNANEARKIAFYLPQFHRIPENDKWWGDGFTEWTNVKKAVPLFSNHIQPIVPTELGYYDLNSDSVREMQIDLAKSAGIEGFCYWHYWFGNGKRLLEMPFQRVLEDKSLDFPFCLCWANQSWTGVWHGAPRKMLMKQEYGGDEDLQAHFNFLLQAFRDDRYITYGGKPVLIIYDVSNFSDPEAYLGKIRNMALDCGLPGIHLIAMAGDLTKKDVNLCDQVMTFGPGDFLLKRKLNVFQRAFRRFAGSGSSNLINRNIRRFMKAPLVYEYKDVVSEAFENLPHDNKYVTCVTTGWDNTPRSGRRGVVFQNYSPSLVGEYTSKALKRNRNVGGDNFLFFKAWNEWAEGNILEPDERFGREPLDAVRRAIDFDKTKDDNK